MVNSVHNLRSKKRPSSTISLLTTKAKKKCCNEIIKLDQLVLDSIVQNFSTSISEQMGFELVNQNFASTLRFAAYPCYRHLKIEFGSGEDDYDDEERQDDVFRIEICKELNDDWLASYIAKDPVKCLVVIFARFSVTSLITNSLCQWEINEMILRAVIIVKCEIPKIKRIFMNVLSVSMGEPAENMHISTPAFFGKSLRLLHINNIAFGTFHNTTEYFGEYTKSINVRQLTLRNIDFPTPHCLSNSFGHMSELKYLNLIMTSRTSSMPLTLQFPGTIALLSKLRSFHLELWIPIGKENDPQIDAYISACKKLPKTVRLSLNWTNPFDYNKVQELADQLVCAHKIASRTRATVTVLEQNKYRGKRRLQMFQRCTEEVCEIIKRNKLTSGLTVSSDVDKAKTTTMLQYQITLQNNTMTFQV